MYIIVSTKQVYYNQVNDAGYNKLKFDRSSSLASNTVKDPLHIVTIRLIGGKTYI